MKISIEDVLGSALHPITWLSWIPQDILEKLPYNVRVMISNINGLWVITDEEVGIVWSSETVEIEKAISYSGSSRAAEFIKKMMASVSPNPDFDLTDITDDNDDIA